MQRVSWDAQRGMAERWEGREQGESNIKKLFLYVARLWSDWVREGAGATRGVVQNVAMCALGMPAMSNKRFGHVLRRSVVERQRLGESAFTDRRDHFYFCFLHYLGTRSYKSSMLHLGRRSIV